MMRIKFVDVPPLNDVEALVARFTATWRRLRAAKIASLAELPPDPNAPRRRGKAKPSTPSYEDTRKIRRRAERLVERQKAVLGVSNLSKDELTRLQPVLQGVDLVLAQSEDWADEIAAGLHADMPWMAPATLHVLYALRRAARQGSGISMQPVILNGPPGIGKSVWARKLAEHLELPMVTIDASKGGAGFALAGVERGWSTSQPGKPLELILTKRIANPIIIVDEICKAKSGSSQRSKGSHFSFADALLALIEPATARDWECISFRRQFDMSHILWVITANTIDDVPETLRSRCQVIQLSDITLEQMLDFARVQGQKMDLSEAAIAAVLDTIKAAPGVLKRRLSLRDVARFLETAEALQMQPRLQ